MYFAATEPVTHVWHYWLGVVLAISAIGLVLTLAALYLVTVVRTRYTRKDA